MHLRGVLLVTIAAAALSGSAAAADDQPPLPQPANGRTVTALARGLPLPTGIAIGKGSVFVATFGSEYGKTRGGIFRLAAGTATKVVDGMFIGVAWKAGSLYATGTVHRIPTK